MKTNNLPSVFTYIPIGLDNLEELLVGTGLCPDVMRGIFHQLYLVRIFESMNNKKKKSYWHKERWVPLKSDVIKIIAGRRDYQKYMNWLAQNRYVMPKLNGIGNKGYLVGQSCIKYKISPILLSKKGDKRSFRKEKITKYKVLKRIKKLADYYKTTYQKKSNKIPFEPIHLELIEMAQQVRFDIDKAKAIMQEHNMIEREEKLSMLEAINEGSIPIGMVEAFGERFYSPFSNLKSELRSSIFFKDYPDQSLISFDIKNSQFYFLTLALNTDIINKFLPEFNKCVEYLKEAQNNLDFKIFSQMCSDSKLNKFNSIYEYWDDIRGLGDREKAKKQLFRIIFSPLNNKNTQLNKAKSIFNIHFPTVNKMITNIKSLSESELPFILNLKNYKDESGRFLGKAAYHKNLALMLQRIESRMVIKGVAPLLIEAGIKFITIHDQIFCLEKDANVTKKTIEDYFKNLGFLPPGLKKNDETTVK